MVYFLSIGVGITLAVNIDIEIIGNGRDPQLFSLGCKHDASLFLFLFSGKALSSSFHGSSLDHSHHLIIWRDKNKGTKVFKVSHWVPSCSTTFVPDLSEPLLRTLEMFVFASFIVKELCLFFRSSSVILVQDHSFLSLFVEF